WLNFYFFFSSRRRHTRSKRDWSSDVCSSDLDLPFLQLADHFTLTTDEPIYFIGNPLRFTGIANEGVVLDYIMVKSKEEPVVMMDAPVYRGNSGSPVINEAGKVIGVIFATSHTNEAGRVGLFIPIDYFHERYSTDGGM